MRTATTVALPAPPLRRHRPLGQPLTLEQRRALAPVTDAAGGRDKPITFDSAL